MSSLILRRRNKLAYPGGQPGFDPSHPAAKSASLSLFAAGNNFIDLLTGKPGSGFGGEPSWGVTNIGPSVMATGGNPDSPSQWIGRPAGVDLKLTMAVICQLGEESSSRDFWLSTSGNAGSGVQFGFDSGEGVILNRWGASNDTSSMPLVPNVPYFVALSCDGVTATNFIATRLDNGKITTSTQIPSGEPGAGDGTYGVWSGPGDSFPFLGSLSHAMIARSFMTMPQLLQWASDPWSFWYPQKLDLAMMLRRTAASNDNASASITLAPVSATTTARVTSTATASSPSLASLTVSAAASANASANAGVTLEPLTAAISTAASASGQASPMLAPLTVAAGALGEAHLTGAPLLFPLTSAGEISVANDNAWIDIELQPIAVVSTVRSIASASMAATLAPVSVVALVGGAFKFSARVAVAQSELRRALVAEEKRRVAPDSEFRRFVA